MFSIFKTHNEGTTIKIKIDGMHCTSCSMTIDGELEEIAGIFEASTNYAKSETVVRFNPDLVRQEKIFKAIETLGYKAMPVE